MPKTQKSSNQNIPLILQDNFYTELESVVIDQIKNAIGTLGLDSAQVTLEHPEDLRFGDFTTNLALTLFSQVKKDPQKSQKYLSPLALAQKIASQIDQQSSDLFAKVEVLPPGYLNFWLKNRTLLNLLFQIIEEKENFGKLDFLANKKILLEHTSPNPTSTFHVGHLRNNFLGMSLARIFESLGAQVTLDCINNDRGTHVSRSIFGYLCFGRKELNLDLEALKNFSLPDEKVSQVAANANWQQLIVQWLTSPGQWIQPQDLSLKSDHLNLIFYSLGYRAETLILTIKDQQKEILRVWEEDDSKVRALWRQIMDWSQTGYQQTYQRIASHHDHVWYESELYQAGKELVQMGLEKGVFQKSQGAIVTNLSAYKLPDTPVIKSDGTSLYITFDLNLTQQKRQKFPSDLYIWDIGNDQLLYLKQLFAVCEQLGIGKIGDYFHLNYGYVSLSAGQKMSSRRGTVIKADDLLDLLHQKAFQIITSVQRGKETEPGKQEEIAEKVALAAVKYGLLKTHRTNDICFDPEKSVSLQGDSGPYLQYTYARCQSVLQKAIDEGIIFSLSASELFPPDLITNEEGDNSNSQGQFFSTLSKEESLLFRTLYRFPEVIIESGQKLSPSFLCHFLLDLAQKFNLVYNLYSILTPEKSRKKESPDQINPQVKESNQSASSVSPADLSGKLAPASSDEFTLSSPKGHPEPSEDGPSAPTENSHPELISGSSLSSELAPEDGKFAALRNFRLALTAATSQILENGLTLLGIEPLKKM